MATPSKTPKTPTKGGDPSAPQPSVQEGCFFLSILNNIQNKPEIDWPKVAMEAGFKNAETAKVCRVLRRLAGREESHTSLRSAKITYTFP